MNLLDGRYAPITDSMGFLEADFAAVVAADRRWREAHGSYHGRPVQGPLPALLDSLLPLTGPLLRRLWVQTTGSWTAYFDNYVGGSDTFGPISYLSEKLECRGLAINCRVGTSRRGAATGFTLYGPEPTDWLNVIRSVSAVEDMGRWKWTETGRLQGFEQPERYRERRVRDRLTPEMLAAYTANSGLLPFDDSFYGKRGQLIESPSGKGHMRTETLQEARQWHGLE